MKDSAKRLSKIAMGASLGVAVLMLVGKCTAFYITGSVAILSDAAESVIHIIATGLAAFSLWFSMRPADANHPYGHGKIAYFSAGFEGALILVAAVGVIGIGITGLIQGVELRQLGIGLVITAALGFVNLGLGLFLVYAGKKTNQLILIANGKHVLTDSWTSAGVVVGVGLVYVTGITWLDPLMAVLVGSNILVSAIALIRRAVQGLLDEVNEEDTARLLECLNSAVQQEVVSGFHQLRHRATNTTMWIEVHFLLPDEMENAEAHRRATLVEKDIQGLFKEYTVQITTHIEPVSHDSAHPKGHEGMNSPYTEGGKAL